MIERLGTCRELVNGRRRMLYKSPLDDVDDVGLAFPDPAWRCDFCSLNVWLVYIVHFFFTCFTLSLRTEAVRVMHCECVFFIDLSPGTQRRMQQWGLQSAVELHCTTCDASWCNPSVPVSFLFDSLRYTLLFFCFGLFCVFLLPDLADLYVFLITKRQFT